MKSAFSKIIFLVFFACYLGNFKLFSQTNNIFLKKQPPRLSHTEKNTKNKQKRTNAPTIKPHIKEKISILDTAKSQLITEKMVFPLPKGKLLYGYGDRSPQNLKNIKIKNLGIDIIQTDEKHGRIIAVASGKVVRIVKLKDRIGEIIVIKHQDFFSVYAHTLPLFSLKKNKFVKKGQTIGSVMPDKNQQRILHFEIWHKKKSLDPMQFFKK